MRGGAPVFHPDSTYGTEAILWGRSTENTRNLTVFASAHEAVISWQERQAERYLVAAPSTDCSAF